MDHVNTVFLVDDEKMANVYNKNVFKAFGYSGTLQSFDKPLQAIEQLRQLASGAPGAFPQLLLLDILMPEMDGWAFLDEYEKLPKDVTSGCRVILLTAVKDLSEIHMRSYSSVNGYLSKPLTVEQLKFLFKS